MTTQFVDTLKEGIIKVLGARDVTEYLLESLQQVYSSQAVKGLGDRSKYVGASDLDKCIRNAVLSKRSQKGLDLKRAMYFMRGHLAELIVLMALRAQKVPFQYQPEIVHPNKAHIKAHIDFLSETDTRIHTLEIKSGPLRDNTDFWQRQLATQIGIAQETRPRKKATGSILNIDLTAAEIRYFNGFEHDPSKYEECVDRADLIWETMKNGKEDNHAKRDFLCAWCDHLEGCPAFRGEGYPEFPVLGRDYVDYELAKGEAKSAQQQADFLKDNLLEILKGIGRKINVGDWVVWASKRTRAGGVDWKKLAKEKPSVHKEIKSNFMKPDSEYFVLDSFEIQPEADVSQEGNQKAA